MNVATESVEPIARGPILHAIARVFLGTMIGLILFDVGVSVYDRRKDLTNTDLHVRHEQLVWTNRPGFRNERTYINSFGLRSPDIPADAPKDEVRIVGYGASRCFGAGQGNPPMDLAWSQQLENILNEEREGSWRVLNGGVMGYSGLQAARRAILMLDELQPDLVLVFLSPGRQLLLDPSNTKKWMHVRGRMVPADIAESFPEALVPAAAAANELLLHSALYKRYRIQLNEHGRVRRKNRDFVLSRAKRDAEATMLLERTQNEMRELLVQATARGVEVRAILIPEPCQDSDAEWNQYLRKYAQFGAPPRGTPREEPIAVMAEWVGEAGVRSWSFMSEISIMGEDRGRFTCDGAHWSAAGHLLIAKGIARHMHSDGTAPRLIEHRRRNPRR